MAMLWSGSRRLCSKYPGSDSRGQRQAASNIGSTSPAIGSVSCLRLKDILCVPTDVSKVKKVLLSVKKQKQKVGLSRR